MRSIAMALGVLVACGGSKPPPPVPNTTTTATATATTATPPPTTDPPPPDAADAPWSYGQPIPCTTVDDCMLVGARHFACPGPCSCPVLYLAPRGSQPVSCPEPSGPPRRPGAPRPDPPNCAACLPMQPIRAVCTAGVCATVPDL